MFKQNYLLWLMFSSLFLANFSLAAECKKLKAYGNPEYPPYLWRASATSPKMAGALVDFAKEISQEIGVSIDPRYGGTWARVQEEARYGRVDIVLGVFHNKAREKYLEYMRPALTQTRSVVWVRSEDLIKFTQWSDLKGLPGVTVINNSFGQDFDIYARDHLDINFVASLQQALDMLKNKRVRYLLYEEWPAKSYILKSKITGVKALEPNVAEEFLYVAVAKKSRCNTPALREKLNATLDKVHKRNLMPALLKDNSQKWDEAKP